MLGIQQSIPYEQVGLTRPHEAKHQKIFLKDTAPKEVLWA
jgi:hypothetical protein